MRMPRGLRQFIVMACVACVLLVGPGRRSDGELKTPQASADRGADDNALELTSHVEFDKRSSMGSEQREGGVAQTPRHPHVDDVRGESSHKIMRRADAHDSLRRAVSIIDPDPMARMREHIRTERFQEEARHLLNLRPPQPNLAVKLAVGARSDNADAVERRAERESADAAQDTKPPHNARQDVMHTHDDGHDDGHRFEHRAGLAHADHTQMLSSNDATVASSSQRKLPRWRRSRIDQHSKNTILNASDSNVTRQAAMNQDAPDRRAQDGRPTIEPGCPWQALSASWLHSVPPAGLPNVSGTLAIIGIARNIGRGKVRHAIRELTVFGEGVFGGRFEVFFVENDSDDCTGTALKEWEHADPSRVHIVSRRIGAAAPRLNNHRERIRRLAGFRNDALEMMRHSRHAPFDFVIAIDLDMKPTWRAETLAKPFRYMPCKDCTWRFDMVCANGVMSEHDNRFYDAFALRSKAFPSGPLDVSPYFGSNGYVLKVMQGMRRTESEPPVMVESCFSGLAVYRGDMFSKCNYSSPDGDCEHVHIHRCMRSEREAMGKQAAFWMMPSMRMVYDLDEIELRGYGVNV